MSQTKHLTILQINDVHGYLEAHPELFWEGGQAVYRTAGGYARIATLFDQIRRENPGDVLALDGGDTLHGTYSAVQSQGWALLPILSALGLDGMTAHWEFAYGPQNFKALVEKLPYPMLAINCYDKASGELVFKPYTILERAGLRIGVIGIAATIVDKTMPASFSEGLYFTLGDQELPGYIRSLRQDHGVDLVIVLSHLGFPQELKLARQVDGIDVLLSSHTHNRLYRPARVNDTIIIQSGCHGSFVGRLDLEFDSSGLVDFSHQLIVVEEAIQPQPEMQSLVDQALAPQRAELNQVVGQTATALNRNRVLEATMDNLLTQSLRELSGAQLAFANGWRYGAPIPAGKLTLNDLWNMIPVNPPVSTCDLTGEELWQMLEENLEHTFSADPYQQMGGYVKRNLGLNLYFKIENPAGERIQELFVGDKPVRPRQVYSAAFVTSQGVPAAYGSQRRDLQVSAIEALRLYLANHNPAQAELCGTIVAV
ncbi:MAG: 5'-nucleotidase C-terminal domain-containing protein [Anaerolineales bacterium]|jgi:2',3'-cyclic-nucleotide 2'-phosphodiesterase (5'-nucleotidase family)|nr:5'-nucleotidase C-terminal domain-containing protein [Anaerolineales bacterium]